MKKVSKILLLLFLMIIMPISALAEGTFSVSENSITLNVGEKKNIEVTATNAAEKLLISSSNTKVATVSPNSIFPDNNTVSPNSIFPDNNTEYITIEAVAVGKATITVLASDEFATSDEEILEEMKRTITVNVTDKNKQDSVTILDDEQPNEVNNNPTPTPTPSPTPAPTPVVTKSENNKVEEILIEGHVLEKVDDNNYTLTVLNNVDSIEIKVIPEDSKAKISGDGNKDLKEGENNFEIVVTSESGVDNKINIKVTRKKGYSIEDLKDILGNEELDNISIAVNKNTIITSETVSKIKENGKKVYLNYYNSSKKLMYSIIVDGTKIENANEINTNILDSSSNSKKIKTLSKNAKGTQINLKNTLPEGTIIKLYVGDKFKNGEVLDVYYYDKENDKLELYKEDLTVANGYIEFDADSNTNYFVTKLLNESDSTDTKEKKNISLGTPALILTGIVLLLLIIAIVMFINNKKDDD